jgi:hypothetical protein
MRRRLGITFILTHLNIHSLLAIAGMAGPIVLVVTELVAGLSAPRYDIVYDSISSLALTRLGFLQSIGFLGIGLLVEIYVAGLLYNIHKARGFRFGVGLLVFFGFGLLLVGAFRTDPVGTERTVEGAIHWIAALTVFWSFPLGILLLAPSLRSDHFWKKFYVYTIITGILALILVSVLVAFKDHISWFGLYERILVANMIIWVEVTAIRLLYLSIIRE